MKDFLVLHIFIIGLVGPSLLFNNGPIPLFAEATQYSKICPLKNTQPVPLEYDAATGTYSLFNSSKDDDQNGSVFTRRRLESNDDTNSVEQTTMTVQLGRRRVSNDDGTRFLRGGNNNSNNNNSNKRRTSSASSTTPPRPPRALGPFSHDIETFSGENVYMAKPCPCDDTGRVYCLVEGTNSGSVADTCGIPANTGIITVSPSEDGTTTTTINSNSNNETIIAMECFELGNQTVFIRNAWPVVVLWYGALFIFLLATDNGKNARGYVLHKLCPSLQTNERQVDRILARENEIRDRLRAAAVRAINLAEGPGRYLIRTRGIRVPGTIISNGGVEDERDDAARHWIEQAEALGIFNAREVVEIEMAAASSRRPQRREYVLKTKKFDSKKERMRREKNMQSNDSGGNNEDEEEESSPEAEEGVATPIKKGTNSNQGPSTPETVASADDLDEDVDEDEPTDENEQSTSTESNESENAEQSNAALSNVDSPLFQSTPDQPTILTDDNEESQNEKSDNVDEFDEDDTFDCTICLGIVEDGEQIGALPCSHIFHALCLKQWIKRRNVCPLCQIPDIATPRAIEASGTGDNEIEVSNDSSTEGASSLNQSNAGEAGNNQRDASEVASPLSAPPIRFSSRLVNPPRRSTLLSPNSAPPPHRLMRDRNRRRPQRSDDFW